MKYIIILGDGMADEPIAELGGKTPLEAASTPHMDWLAKHSRLGLLNTVPQGYAPGSEVAHLALLGYDLDKVFEGRGTLEAASMGIAVEPGEMAMRCNIICIEDEKIKNHSAGHISDEEARELIDYLNEELSDDRVRFFPGVSYRHLIKIKGGDKRIKCTPPHDVPGTPYKDVMVEALVPEAEETARLINELTLRSQELLSKHPVNLKRVAEGKDPANSIWTWSPGYKPAMETLGEKFGIKNGTVISAVDLIRGIGVYCGLKPLIIDGATGLWNTNYEGKAQAAINALKNGSDFVFLHVEASDEAGHEGDYELKKRTIESLDERICRPVIEAMKEIDEPVSIAILPDHPTPCRIRTHSSNPVPFLIYRPGQEPDDVEVMTESAAEKGSYGTMSGDEFIKEFLKK
ncbi:MAG: cofactor-independent phosphoglycerate mutase [Muribaculaceae bacterium]|nr:cofactor-independent phosphoglycerate mutase [Muribaculaceae bacterium]MEE1298718.1 cofactor-independent phosphoglycerate mutase [Muribaculaceae bacterium]